MDSQEGYNATQLITNVIMPRLEDIDRRLRRAEGSAVPDAVFRTELTALQNQTQELRRDMEKLKESILSPDSIAALIGQALQSQQARGWTNRERYMGLVLFAITLATFVFTALQFVGQGTHGTP